MRFLVFIIALFTFTTGLAATEIIGRATVVDGDTIEIQGQRIRFAGIDAPESSQVCQDANDADYKCGQTSAAALDAFLAESRPTTCSGPGHLHWKRLIATCKRADGVDVNRWLVTNGHAIDWPKYSKGKYAPEQEQAQEEKRGLWSGSFQWPCEVRGVSCF